MAILGDPRRMDMTSGMPGYGASAGILGASQPNGGMLTTLGGQLGDWFRNNPNAIMGLAANLLQPGQFNANLGSGLQAFQQGGAIDQETQGQNKTREAALAYAKQAGFTPQQLDMIGTSKEAQRAIVAKMFEGPKEAKEPNLTSIYNDQGQEQKGYFQNGQFVPVGGAKQEKRDTATPPAGYLWNDPADPNAGVRPIAGGPAEKIDAAEAARLGMTKSFLDEAPTLRDKIAKGALSDVMNRGSLAVGAGDAGQIYRSIQSGADALIRNLTGAGMTVVEAEAYAARYLPSAMDSQDTMLDKFDRLQRELVAVAGSVGRGRGGADFATGGSRGERKQIGGKTYERDPADGSWYEVQ
jgi:hypothetical protein